VIFLNPVLAELRQGLKKLSLLSEIIGVLCNNIFFMATPLKLTI